MQNWDDLKIVLAVAEAGSVNAAARKLGVNHATVLRRLEAFEDRHQISLFQKARSGYRFDPTMLPILERLQEVDASVDAFERALAGQNTGPRGSVTITSTDSLCRVVLPQIVTDLHRMHDSLLITVLSSNAHLNFSKLDADVTVRPANTLPPELLGTQICTMGFRPYATPAFLAANPDPDRWIGVTDNLLRSPVGQWMGRKDPACMRILADSFVSMAHLALTGSGAAMLPCCLGDMDRNLRRVPSVPIRLETNLWVACHRDVASTPRVEVVMDFLTSGLQSYTELIEGY